MTNKNDPADTNLDCTLDWEYMSDFYVDSNQTSTVRSFEEIAKECEANKEAMEQTNLSQNSSNELLIKTATDVKHVRELSQTGKTVKEITSLLSLTEDYVLSILMTLQGYSEDSDIAIAHLILL